MQSRVGLGADRPCRKASDNQQHPQRDSQEDAHDGAYVVARWNVCEPGAGCCGGCDQSRRAGDQSRSFGVEPFRTLDFIGSEFPRSLP
jgi:hypothetical protein